MAEHSFDRPSDHRPHITPSTAHAHLLMDSGFVQRQTDVGHRSSKPPVEPAPTHKAPPVEPPPSKPTPPVEPPPKNPVEPPPKNPVKPPPKNPVEPPPKNPVEPPPHNPVHHFTPYSPPAEPFAPHVPKAKELDKPHEKPGKPATTTEVTTVTPEHVIPGKTVQHVTETKPNPVVVQKPEHHPTPQPEHHPTPQPEHHPTPTHHTPEHHHTPERHHTPEHHHPTHHHPTHHTPEHTSHHTPEHHHGHHHHVQHHHASHPPEHHVKPVPPPAEHKPVPPPAEHKPVPPAPEHNPIAPAPEHKPVPPPADIKPVPPPPEEKKPVPPPSDVPPSVVSTKTVVPPTVEPPETKVQTTVVPAQPAQGEQKTSNLKPPNWGEVSTSFSSQQVLTTATVGGNFNSRDYWRASLDASLAGKHTGLGDLTVTAGHSLFDAYDKQGNPRNGNINFEVGAVLPTGKTFQFGKLPQVGDAGPVIGINGYYGLDRKTTAYGSFDYALHPGSQSSYEYDAQTGLLRREGRFTFGLGGEYSKVDGSHASKFFTPSVEYDLNKRTSLYASGALSLDGQKQENALWTGVRFKF